MALKKMDHLSDLSQHRKRFPLVQGGLPVAMAQLQQLLAVLGHEQTPHEQGLHMGTPDPSLLRTPKGPLLQASDQ